MTIEIPSEMQAQLPRGSCRFGGKHETFDNQYYFTIFREMLREIVEEQRPMTVRQVFYRAVVKGWIEKTERGYGFVQRDLVRMRWDGDLPFDWIEDRSREAIGWQGRNESVDEFWDGVFNIIPYRYSRNMLADYDWSVQVWLEKEALAGIFEPICKRWDVPLYPARGYSSLTMIHDAAKDLEAKDRPARILHFGDYDPSGQDAILTVQRDLKRLAPKTYEHGLEFKIVAVTPEQIQELALPTRPTKQSDTRSWGFGNESVELDAIEPDVLRQMVNDELQSEFPEGAREENARLQEETREEIRRRLRELGLIE